MLRARPWRSTWKRWRSRGCTMRWPALDLADQAVEVGQEVGVDAVEVGGDDGAEQQAAEAGGGSTGSTR